MAGRTDGATVVEAEDFAASDAKEAVAASVANAVVARLVETAGLLARVKASGVTNEAARAGTAAAVATAEDSEGATIAIAGRATMRLPWCQGLRF